jgi:hypothetical protein
MLDNKIILDGTNKMLDILSGQGYIWGKLEIDYDQRTKKRKIQIHTFEKHGTKTIRITDVIIEQ